MGMDWRKDFRDFVARISEAKNRAEQALINAAAGPIEAVIGFGDTASGGITRYIRQWQGTDIPGLECSGWYNAGGWAAVAVEVATGVGGLTKAGGKFALKKALKEGGESLDDAAKAYAKSRPSHGKNQVDDVFENAKQADGKVYDPNTGAEIPWDRTRSRANQWDMGHKPGKEYRKYHKDYMDGKITKEEFKEIHRNPNNYQPELPGPNRSRRYEQP